jgi:hypothetical protein
MLDTSTITTTAVTEQSQQLQYNHSSYRTITAVTEQPQQLQNNHSSYSTTTAATEQPQQQQYNTQPQSITNLTRSNDSKTSGLPNIKIQPQASPLRDLCFNT